MVLEVAHQETEGLLSPLIRDIRLRKAASHVGSKATVLDLACGEGYLRRFLPSGCRYYGADRVRPSSTAHFSDFTELDLREEASLDHLRAWLPERPDCLTCIAFLEHLSDPGGFVAAYRSLLAKPGKLIGTTPHPRGRSIHESLASIHLCSRHGAEEHEQFLGRTEIESLAAASGGTLSVYRQFLAGLNQLFVIEYP
jgi:2-polyprenyl-3-methyl-5-hydroxy-6-metoxy-1,4-benzoquinol methylase